MIKNLSTRLPKIAAALAAFTLSAGLIPSLASAQEDAPPYAQPAPGGDEVIQGRIASINSTFNISVNDARGFVDNVDLHQGTIINPTGLTLEPGMAVTIDGYTDGDAFDANEINTPYTYSGPLPAPVYYGPGWWYPGFAYGYGPSFSLSLVIGGGHPYFERGAWHGRAYPSSAFAGGSFRASFNAARPGGFARPAAPAYYRGGSSNAFHASASYGGRGPAYRAPASYGRAPASGGRAPQARGGSRGGDRGGHDRR